MCHWYALCVRLSGRSTVPTAGRSAGNAELEVNPGFCCSTCATVRMFEVGYFPGGACFRKAFARLLGNCCCTNCANCWVSTVATDVLALDEDSPKAPTKKNSLSFKSGPPKAPPYSFLRNAGTARHPTSVGAQY